jgi:hypothetical protein
MADAQTFVVSIIDFPIEGEISFKKGLSQVIAKINVFNLLSNP